MKTDEVLTVTAILNEMLLGLDQSATPERRQAAERYAEIMQFLASELERRIALLESGQRHEAVLCCRGESPLPELARQARLANGKRYRELCASYGWPMPLQLHADQLQRLTDAGGEGISLRDLLNRWRNEAAILPPAEKIALLRRIRQLDPTHESHWLRLFPEVERDYCRELQAQASETEDAGTLAAIAKEALTAEWVSPAAAELRDGIVTKLRRIQMADRRLRVRHELDRLADAASRRDPDNLAGALREMQILMSDPDCSLSDAEQLQLKEAQKLMEELYRQRQLQQRVQGLEERINTALDEGSSYDSIAEDFHALLESGAVIDPDLATRVQTSQKSFEEELRAKTRRRWRFAGFVAVILAVLTVWIVLKTHQERCLNECVTAAAAYLRNDRPHDADEVMKQFLKKFPAASDRSSISLRRSEIMAALKTASERSVRFDQLTAALAAPPPAGEEKAFWKRFRRQEALLEKLPTADDPPRQQRLAELRVLAAQDAETALRQRESETLRLCDGWQRQLADRHLKAEAVRRIAIDIDRRRHPEIPLTVLEKESLDGCQQLVSALLETQKKERDLKLLLERLPQTGSADEYLRDRTLLSRSTYHDGAAAAWRATDDRLPVWSRIAAFRINNSVFTDDHEADEFLKRIARELPGRILNQTLLRLFPADKLAGKPYLTDFRKILKQWETDLNGKIHQDLYEIVLIGPQRKKYHLFCRGPVRIERAGRGLRQPLAMQLDALESPTAPGTERLTFRWQKTATSSHFERVGKRPESQIFRQLPLAFSAVEGCSDLTQLVPQKALHVQLGLECVSLLKKCQDRDEAQAIVMRLLAALAGDQRIEPSRKAEMARRHWALLASLEPMAAPAADEYAGALKRTLPANWNWCDPLLQNQQPQTIRALTGLLDPQRLSVQLKALTDRRDLERLAMIRFPRPAGVVLQQPKGGSKIHLFAGMRDESELWFLTENDDGMLFFQIVKEHGKTWQHVPQIPHGTMLFAPADDLPTPAVDRQGILPQCWPSRRNHL